MKIVESIKNLIKKIFGRTDIVVMEKINPRILFIDDNYGVIQMLAKQYLFKFDKDYLYGLPEDESILADYDVLVVDNQGIGNSKYRNGFDFLKEYEKQGHNTLIIAYSGNNPDRETMKVFNARGVVFQEKGDFVKVANIIREYLNVEFGVE